MTRKSVTIGEFTISPFFDVISAQLGGTMEEFMGEMASTPLGKAMETINLQNYWPPSAEEQHNLAQIIDRIKATEAKTGIKLTAR